MVQIETAESLKNSHNISTGLPDWLIARLDARTAIIKPFLASAESDHEKEYYQGYLDALLWMRHQTEFPCTGCRLTDCSHHGSSYNCAGNCSSDD